MIKGTNKAQAAKNASKNAVPYFSLGRHKGDGAVELKNIRTLFSNLNFNPYYYTTFRWVVQPFWQGFLKPQKTFLYFLHTWGI
jgi:hypothetical protein